MFTNVNVDCCKTPGCKNLGLLNSQDYIAQGKNILCRECGYFFPVISERSLNIYRNRVNHSWRGLVPQCSAWEGANKQVISSQADSLIKISRIWADFFPANTSNQPI